ncbi:hypothetical protein DM02DRAFT_298048 [Periconia macrospinosa]|uniref:Uncharacterized protein n=1 Tax=Periconia macrospinosa TaxID=97972 RepID=A0A2V1D265_9PLEO|nr:hypothetical protein DM02DRAFT_298048 [Periconia macrospinosa]
MPSLPLQKAARFEDLVAYVDHRSHPFFVCRTCQVAIGTSQTLPSYMDVLVTVLGPIFPTPKHDKDGPSTC